MWCLILSAGLLFPAGCQESTKSPYGGGVKTVPYMVSAAQLAARLNLQNSFANGRYIELTNSTNRVLIFTHPGGSVYVNGQNIGLAGTQHKEDGTLYFSELLIPRIRGYLNSQAPLPQPNYNSSSSSSQYVGRTVVIDAGHGGKDPGAISYLGYYEKEVNLKVAQKVAWRLKQLGIRVIMTRNDDFYPELNDRAEIANRANADLFVSIHHNSNRNRIHRGYTVYIAPDASDTSRRTGRLIEKAMANTGLSSNGMRTNDYRVLMRTQCPAVLVECGYLSNPSEAAILYDGDFQNRIANAIVEGIQKSF